MNQSLNQEQLNQIIAEVQTLQLRQAAELDHQQVREILQDLNLPPELLDEALFKFDVNKLYKSKNAVIN